jgi:heat shock protein 5
MTGRQNASNGPGRWVKPALAVFALVATFLVCQDQLWDFLDYREDDYEEIDYGITIGIDVGNTNSRYMSRGQYHLMEQSGNRTVPSGNRTVPSVVKMTDSGLQHYSHDSPGRGRPILYKQEYLGLTWDELLAENLLPSDVYMTERVGNRMAIQAQGINGETLIYPEDIATSLLSKLKYMAEKDSGRKVTRAILGVPCGYTDNQRSALIEAAEKAGLTNLHPISECAAAGIVYNLGVDSSFGNALFVDVGGETLKVTAMEFEYDYFEKLAFTSAKIAGNDFTQRIIDRFIKRVYRTRWPDVRVDMSALSRLHSESNKAKEALSYSDTEQALLSLKEANTGVEFNETLTRAEFEDLNADLFQKIITNVKKTMQDAKMKVEDVKEIVLTGGSSNIPMIQELLRQFFQKDLLLEHKGDAIVRGAAGRGDFLDMPQWTCGTGAVYYPLSIGIESHSGIVETIVALDERIPLRRSRYFSTATNNQTSLQMNVFVRDSKFARKNVQMATIVVPDIPPAPAGIPLIKVSIKIDEDLNARISAKHPVTGRQFSTKPISEFSSLSRIMLNLAEDENESVNPSWIFVARKVLIRDSTGLDLKKDFAIDPTTMKRNSFRGYLAEVEKEVPKPQDAHAFNKAVIEGSAPWLEAHKMLDKDFEKKERSLKASIEKHQEWAFYRANTATYDQLDAQLKLLRREVFPIVGRVDFEPIPVVGGAAPLLREHSGEPLLLGQDEV